MTARSLYACEVKSWDGARALHPCGLVATLYVGAGGKTYKLCQEHAATFAADVTPVAESSPSAASQGERDG